jgi:hypothetical protein
MYDGISTTEVMTARSFKYINIIDFYLASPTFQDVTKSSPHVLCSQSKLRRSKPKTVEI